MSDLPITKNDYDRAVVLANVLSEFKSICEMREDISDVHFTPQANGYDISFRQNGTDTKLFITFKNRYTDSLTIKRFDGESLTASFALKKTDSLSGLLEAVLHPCPSQKKSRPSGLLFLLAVVLVAAVYAVATAFSIVSYSHLDEARPADAAVVLGAGTSDGQVSPVFRERINHAIDLYESGTIKYIIMTGGTGDGNTVSDAFAAKQYAISQGVPESRILTEEKSAITEENLEYSKAIMDGRRLDSALIVSDPLHMKRAMIMADDYGITAFSSPTPSTMYRSLKTKFPFLLREIFFYIGYRIVRIFR